MKSTFSFQFTDEPLECVAMDCKHVYLLTIINMVIMHNYKVLSNKSVLV
jgi:hypothetical protein